MNAYYNKNEAFDSNKRIIEAYFGESVRAESPFKKLFEQVLYLLSVVLQALTCTAVRRVAKATTVAILLIGFVGVIGAMESGALGLGTGLLIGGLLVGLEILCLRPHRA